MSRNAGRVRAVLPKIALAAAAVLVAILVAELALRGLAGSAVGSATGRVPRALPDPVLGQRPNPEFAGHDRRGFRNPHDLDHARIVALGDSQTYGLGVPVAATWPQRLAHLSGRSVYGLAYGGWGPTHSVLLADEALELAPTVLIEAFYAGNDLYDCFTLAYSRAGLERLRTDDSDSVARIAALEAAEPLNHAADRLFLEFLSRNGKRAGPEREFPRMLASRLHLYRLLGNATDRWRSASTRPDERGVSTEPRVETGEARIEVAEHVVRLSWGSHHTAFDAALRALALDLDDARIAEGLRIALASILELQRRSEAAGCRFLLLAIPTKELVYAPLVEDGLADLATPAASSYRRTVRFERAMWDQTRLFCEARGIACISGLDSLREAIANGSDPYPASTDGHPTAAGHDALARSVWHALQ